MIACRPQYCFTPGEGRWHPVQVKHHHYPFCRQPAHHQPYEGGYKYNLDVMFLAVCTRFRDTSVFGKSMPCINQYGYKQFMQLGRVLESALSVIAQCIFFKLDHGQRSAVHPSGVAHPSLITHMPHTGALSSQAASWQTLLAQNLDHALLDKAAAKAPSPTSFGPLIPVSYRPAHAPIGPVGYAHALVPAADAAPSADKVIPGRRLGYFCSQPCVPRAQCILLLLRGMLSSAC